VVSSFFGFTSSFFGFISSFFGFISSFFTYFSFAFLAGFALVFSYGALSSLLTFYGDFAPGLLSLSLLYSFVFEGLDTTIFFSLISSVFTTFGSSLDTF